MPYSQRQLDAAVKRQERAIQQVKFKASGELNPMASIPRELYWNAVKGHGVDPNDREYWNDMRRIVPSIVPQMQRPIRSSLQHLTPVDGVKRRTRFGVATFHKVYR